MMLRVVILILAVGAAGVAAWLTMSVNKPEPQVAAEPKEVPTKAVLVAAQPIAGGDVLSPDKVRWQPLPVTAISEQMVLQEARPDAVAEMSGSFVTRPFAPGEPIRPERLMETNINLMSNKISPGMRAVALKITAENTAGGFILPGDRVDVIHTVTTAEDAGQPARNDSQIIIANARVLAIDQTAVQTPEGSVLGKTATLELTPEEAERVVAAEASGLLQLALRAVTDHTDEREVTPTEIRTVRIHRATQTETVTLR